MEKMEQNNQGNIIPPYWQQGNPIPPAQLPAGRKEAIFGAGLLLLTLGISNSILYGGFYLGFAVFSFGAVLCAILYLLFQKKNMTVYSGALLALSVVICAGFGRSDDSFVKFVMVCFLFVSVNLGLCITAGQNRRSPALFASLADAFRAAFTMGIGKLPAAFRGIHNGVKLSNGFSRKSLSVLLGLVIALPVVCVMIPLLTSADAAFDGLMSTLPEIKTGNLIPTVVLGSMLWCVLYTRTAALVHSEKNPAKEMRKHRGIPAATVNTVLLAVSFIYCVYLASQLAYFFGSFSGILPENYTMAEYARRGFFEMAALCIINLCVILFTTAFVRKDAQIRLFTRILCLFIGMVTLVFVVTASAKMLMYINAYGLTRLRLLTEVIMVFLGLTTAIVCLWLFIPRLPYMKIIILSAMMIGAAVLWTDVDTVVAAYNVNAYQSGQLTSIDMDHLYSLGDGAVPYIAQLINAEDSVIAHEVQNHLQHRHIPSKDLRSWNYASHIAQKYLPDA